jgi:hypothetical protein
MGRFEVLELPLARLDRTYALGIAAARGASPQLA